jgi:hypothetical protein
MNAKTKAFNAMVEWFIENRREIAPAELESLLRQYFPDNTKLNAFIDYSESRLGRKAFERTVIKKLREAKTQGRI